MKTWRALDSAPAAAVAFVALAAILSLPGLGSHSLVRMEGMIAEIAREMLASGDYLVPRLYGEVYAYKPPLLYWLVAAGFRITGSSAEWVVRLPAALSGMLMGLGTLVFVGRIAGYRRGLVAAVAALTGALSLQKLRVAEFDAPLAAFVGIAIAAACYALARGEACVSLPPRGGERESGTGRVGRERGEIRSTGGGRAWWICYAALAAGVLTKGAPALMLFAPGLVAAAVVTGRPRAPGSGPRALLGRLRALGSREHLLGVGLFALIVSAYLWSAHAAAGWEVFRQPLEEARLRGAGWSLRAAGRTLLKPLLIWGYFLPWSVAGFWALPTRRPSRPAGGAAAADRLVLAAWAFVLAGTLASMAVPAHESRYYLPLAVPFGIVCAAGLARMAGSSGRPARLLPAGLAGATGVAALALGVFAASPADSPLARTALVGLGAAALAAAARIAFGSARPGAPATTLLLAALCFWGAETFAFGPKRAASRDQRAAAAELSPSIGEGETVWVLSPAGLAGSYSGLLHYLGRPVRTFEGAAGPPPGAICLLRELDLERVEPAARERLEPIASARGPRWTYLLYRVGGPAAQPPGGGRPSPPEGERGVESRSG